MLQDDRTWLHVMKTRLQAGHPTVTLDFEEAKRLGRLLGELIELTTPPPHKDWGRVG